ncbi:MAG: HAD family hydrolase [Treponema sp.]|nr:HAD family hydrolase [Treponema sp.]
MAVKFKAVAFDLDGTLYPNSRFYIRLIPFVLKEQRFLRAMGRARILLRQEIGDGKIDFYDRQAGVIGEMLGIPSPEAGKKIDALIYRGWEPLFNNVRLYSRIRETLDAFKNAGIRLGLLSDFPPEAKLKNLGLIDYWHAYLSSEETGFLKPHPAPFLELAKRMETEPADILYVGNSIPYDVEGARNAGMKAALIRPWWKKQSLKGLGKDFSCFVFNDYRQLSKYVIN